MVNVFSRVLFHVDAIDADAFRSHLSLDIQMPVFADGPLVLADLISLGKIRVEIIFAREDVLEIDRAIRREPRP